MKAVDLARCVDVSEGTRKDLWLDWLWKLVLRVFHVACLCLLVFTQRKPVFAAQTARSLPGLCVSVCVVQEKGVNSFPVRWAWSVGCVSPLCDRFTHTLTPLQPQSDLSVFSPLSYLSVPLLLHSDFQPLPFSSALSVCRRRGLWRGFSSVAAERAPLCLSRAVWQEILSPAFPFTAGKRGWTPLSGLQGQTAQTLSMNPVNCNIFFRSFSNWISAACSQEMCWISVEQKVGHTVMKQVGNFTRSFSAPDTRQHVGQRKSRGQMSEARTWLSSCPGNSVCIAVGRSWQINSA